MGSGSTSAARPVLEWDWGPVPLLDHHHLPQGGMKLPFLEKCISKDGSEITLRVDEEMMKFLFDLERMVPQQGPKWIDWDQTRKEQGNWPRTILVSMWFKHETNMIMIIELLKIMKNNWVKLPV